MVTAIGEAAQPRRPSYPRVILLPRTSVSHDHNFMFEINSTVWLLLGDGLGKQATLNTVFLFRA